MNTLIILSTMLAAVSARPGLLLNAPIATLPGPLIARLVPGAPIGLDGRVVDTPEVALAKAEHAAAHFNERITHANEALRSADRLILASNVQPIALAANIVPAAPLGSDGRVVDTPEVAIAKAEHAAAHINEKLNLAVEAANSESIGVPLIISTYGAPVIQKYFV